MTYLNTNEAAAFLGVARGSMFRLYGIETVRTRLQKHGKYYAREYHIRDLHRLKLWRASESYAAMMQQNKSKGGRTRRKSTTRTAPAHETAVSPVTVTTDSGKSYTHIPAPWEVPERWEWRA